MAADGSVYFTCDNLKDIFHIHKYGFAHINKLGNSPVTHWQV